MCPLDVVTRRPMVVLVRARSVGGQGQSQFSRSGAQAENKDKIKTASAEISERESDGWRGSEDGRIFVIEKA